MENSKLSGLRGPSDAAGAVAGDVRERSGDVLLVWKGGVKALLVMEEPFPTIH